MPVLLHEGYRGDFQLVTKERDRFFDRSSHLVVQRDAAVLLWRPEHGATDNAVDARAQNEVPKVRSVRIGHRERRSVGLGVLGNAPGVGQQLTPPMLTDKEMKACGTGWRWY